MSVALAPNTDPSPSRESAGVRNLQQLIQLRWIAVIGQVLAIAYVHFALAILLPLQPMLLVLAMLVAYNLVSQIVVNDHRRVTNRALLFALLIDVATLTAQLHFSGGLTNPFVLLFLLHVVLGAILLRSVASWIIAAATTLCVLWLALYPGPVTLPADLSQGLVSLYVQGLLVCFAVVATLLVVFITRIGRILRERDARLAAMRQRAAEEEHIVRMALLASGAAHELGTPLSTLSVILGDWKHLPNFTSDPNCCRTWSRCRHRSCAARPSSAASCNPPAIPAARRRNRCGCATSSTISPMNGAPRARRNDSTTATNARTIHASSPIRG